MRINCLIFFLKTRQLPYYYVFLCGSDIFTYFQEPKLYYCCVLIILTCQDIIYKGYLVHCISVKLFILVFRLYYNILNSKLKLLRINCFVLNTNKSLVCEGLWKPKM